MRTPRIRNGAQPESGARNLVGIRPSSTKARIKTNSPPQAPATKPARLGAFSFFVYLGVTKYEKEFSRFCDSIFSMDLIALPQEASRLQILAKSFANTMQFEEAEYYDRCLNAARMEMLFRYSLN